MGQLGRAGPAQSCRKGDPGPASQGSREGPRAGLQWTFRGWVLPGVGRRQTPTWSEGGQGWAEGPELGPHPNSPGNVSAPPWVGRGPSAPPWPPGSPEGPRLPRGHGAPPSSSLFPTFPALLILDPISSRQSLPTPWLSSQGAWAAWPPLGTPSGPQRPQPSTRPAMSSRDGVSGFRCKASPQPRQGLRALGAH